MTPYLIAAVAWVPFMLLCALTIRDCRRVAAEHDAMIAELQDFMDSAEPRLEAFDLELLDRSL